MFALLFGGKLGELIAPRATTFKEMWSLIKNGQIDRALVELQKPKHSINIYEVDDVAKMTLLHLACAQGAMELVVELLSQGAEVSAVSADGSNSLHFAALNNRKGIVEILLRSGADPSIPNTAGLLPVELATNEAVRELFLRDRSAIFSPIVQTRMLLSDYIEQNQPQVNRNEISVDTTGSDVVENGNLLSIVESDSHFEGNSNSDKVLFNMAQDFNEMTIESEPCQPSSSLSVEVPHPPTGHHSSTKGDYTLVGVSSVRKPKQNSIMVEEYDSGESTTESAGISLEKRLFHDTNVLKSTSPDVRPDVRNGYVKTAATIPKLNFGALAPPPTEAECAQQGTPTSTLLSARSGGVSGSRSNSISNYQTASTQLQTATTPGIGVMTTPRTGRSELNACTGSMPMEITPKPAGSAATTTCADMAEQLFQDNADLRQAVMLAASQTALAMQGNRDDFEARRLMVRNCQKLNQVHLEKLLAFDPRLAMSRTTEMGNLAVDGQTPLHVAAGFGNTEAIKIMVEKGEGVSLWVRDLQGRTPLHVAAAKGNQSTCEYLRRAMRDETQKDPIGENAPMDLAGTTPMGWATIGAKGKPKTGDLIKALFSPGDRTVLPRTPVSTRTGKSPWKVPSAAAGYYDKSVREDLIFAFSEANGWTPYMEDRILVSCPVAGRPAWSLFGVCDGHGGAFCSEYLADHIPTMVVQEATSLARRMSTASLPATIAGDADITPSHLSELLHKVCIDADKQLMAHPRMHVEHTGTTRPKYVCMDSSGSTAVLALVTSVYVAVANVGDSRAVIAQRPEGCQTSGRALHSPFVHSPRSNAPQYSSRNNIDGDNIGNDSGVSDQRSRHNGETGHLLEAVGLSRDHKATIPEERLRAEAAGASIDQVGIASEGREPVFQLSTPASDVKLRMTRSFGDFYLKQNHLLPYEQQAVVAVPEIIVHARSARDAFLVMACDGVFDVMTNQEVVDFMGEKLGYTAYGGPVGGVTTQAAAAACDALLEACLERGTVDNISVVLVVLSHPTTAAAPHTSSERGTPNSASTVRLSHERQITAAATLTPVKCSSAHISISDAKVLGKATEDVDVDLPIFNVSQANAGSLHDVFAAVADDEYEGYAPSPLNTAAGSGRMRKQLSLNNT